MNSKQPFIQYKNVKNIYLKRWQPANRIGATDRSRLFTHAG